ncbi:unnamed protein product, partial [marine sediment metagenome]
QLEIGLNGATLPTLWGVKHIRGRYVLGGLDSGIIRSPEAQDAIDKYTGLTTEEENSIAIFVDAEVAAGHWGTKANAYADSLYDVFWCFGLQLEANALISMHPLLTKTAINNLATFVPGVGFTFNGTTSYLDSAYNPSVDGVKYLQDDMMIGTYILLNNNNGVGAGLIGSNNRTRLTGTGVWAAQQIDLQIPSHGGIADRGNVLVNAIRTAQFATAGIANGVEEGTSTQGSQALLNFNFYIGARNST